MKNKDLLLFELGLLLILLGSWLYVEHCEAKHLEVEPEPAPIAVPFEEEIERDLDIKYEEYEDEQVALLARVIMSEAGLKDSDCKQAVAQTVTNRMRDGRWGTTMEEVVNYPNAYSTQDNGEPNAECYAVARWVLEHPTVFPINMYYFRESKYHSFGTEYVSIDGTYFTTEGEPIWD